MNKLVGFMALVFMFVGVQVCFAELTMDMDSINNQQKIEKIEKIQTPKTLKTTSQMRQRAQDLLQENAQKHPTKLHNPGTAMNVPKDFNKFSVNGSEKVKEGRVDTRNANARTVEGNINNDLTGVAAKRSQFSETSWRSKMRDKIQNLFTRRQNLQQQRLGGQSDSVTKYNGNQGSSVSSQQKVYSQAPTLTNAGGVTTQKIQGGASGINLNK